MRTDIPLACVPGAIPADERPTHFALAARLFGTEARERRALPDGYALRFDAEMFGQVAQFVEHERLCCPFLTFTLELAGAGGPLWLRLTGPAGTREFLDAELTPAPPPCSRW